MVMRTFQRKLIVYLSLFMLPLIVISLISIDRDLSDFIYHHHDVGFLSFFKFITYFGKSDIYILTGLALYFLYRHSKPLLARLGLYLLALNALSGIITIILKFLFGKSRPMLYHEESLFTFKFYEYGYAFNSFPSGHSSTALAVWFGLALLFPKNRFLLIGIGVLIALSRVAIDAHFLSDVFFGAFIGIMSAIFIFNRMKFYDFRKVDLEHYLLLGLFSLFALFISLGYLPLFDLDEGAFSEATREMMLSHNYLTTYLNGELRFDKPILFYWTQLLSFHMHGLNEFGARFSSAIFGGLWVLVTYLFVAKTVTRADAFWSATLLLSTLQTSIIMKASIADSLLNFTIASAMFSIYLFYLKRKPKYIYLAFIAIALGALTKGPVAIVIPLAVSFGFFALQKELTLYLKALLNPKAFALFLLIVLPWYTLEYLSEGQKFIDGFFLKHNIERFSNPMESHSGAWFYYIFIAFIGMIPFSNLMFNAFENFKTKLHEPLNRFLFIWFAFVLIFFSLSGTKLPHYAIYGYTPIIILMAQEIKKIKNEYLLFLPILLFLALFTIAPDLLVYFQERIKDTYAQTLIAYLPNEFGLRYKLTLFLSMLFLMAMMVLRLDIRYKIITIATLFLLNLNFVILHAYANLAQQPIKEAGLIAKKRELDVVMYKMNTPSFIFYSERLVKRQDIKEGDVALLQTHHLRDIKRYESIYQKYGIALIKVLEMPH